MTPARLYSDLLSRLSSRSISLRELASDTAQLCVVAAYVWVILKIAGAL